MNRTSFVLLLVAGLGAGLLAACDATEMHGDARVRLLLTDAPFPFDKVDEANVTILRVELVGDSTRPVLVLDEPQSFNLLTLRDGVTAELADVPVPVDDYRQVRLILAEDASVVMKDGHVFDLKVPSGSQTGIKVLLPELDLDPDDVVTVTLDFDVAESFVVQGNPDTPAGIKGFLFKPVLKPTRIVIDGEEIEVPEDD